MYFDKLANISKKLEENLQVLEYELRDASSFIYQSLDHREKSVDGLNLLQNLNKEWEEMCGQLEEAFAQEEHEVKELEEKLNSFESHFEELQQTQEETETVLNEQNMLDFNTSSLLKNANNDDASPVDETFSLPSRAVPSTPAEYDSETTLYEAPL